MLKLIGAAIVLFSCLAIGMESALGLRNGIRSLSSIVSSLSLLKDEICERLTPMPELLEYLSVRAEQPAASFYGNCLRALTSERADSFADSWRLAIQQTKELQLTPEEALCFAELGKVLGRYDADNQRETISQTQSRMMEYLRAAERERTQKGKVCAALGLSAGLMLVILFI